MTDVNDDVHDIGSLRGAIAAAPDGATIVFAPSVSWKTITLDDGELVLGKNLTIVGPGADKLKISGNALSRVFEVVAGANVTLTGLTIMSGNAKGGNGGNIANAGTLTINACAILSGNAYLGGGIDSTANASLLVNASTFSGNNAFDGGGISSAGNASITNSTFRGNIATNLGGGIFNRIDATQGPASRRMVLVNDTISNNKAGNTYVNDGGGLYQDGTGPGGSTLFANTIVAANIGGDVLNISGAWISSLGHNLIGTADGSAGWSASDLLGTTQSPLDPGLGPLLANGGPTQTMALLPGSPALNAGSNALAPAGGTDERGVPRISQGIVDIGAYEYNPPLTASGMPLNYVRGQSSKQSLARFVDGDANAPAGAYTATISWGDGTNTNASASQGTIVFDGSGGFLVTAGHAYQKAGSYSIKVTIRDDGGNSTTALGVANVINAEASGPNPSDLTVQDASASVGVPFNGLVASFGSSITDASPGDFAATILWGDGNVSSGTITTDGSGQFRVSGSNTYRKAGTNPVTVQVQGLGTYSISAQGSLVVSAATLADSSTPTTFSVRQEANTGTRVLATFTSSNPLANLADFNAKVDWGGSLAGVPFVSIVPVGTSGGVSTWRVMGNAIYSEVGTYPISVSVVDSDGGQLTSKQTTAKVTSNLGNAPLIPVRSILTGSLVVTVTAASNVSQALGFQIFLGDGKQLLGAISPTTSAAGAVQSLTIPVVSGENLVIQVMGQGTYEFNLRVTYLDPFQTPNIRTLFIPTQSDPNSIAVGDLNGGGPDVMISSTTDSDAVDVLLNLGNGVFGAPRSYDAGPGINGSLSPAGRDITQTDLTGDGTPDIVLPNALSGDVSVLVGNGDGTFQPERRFDALRNAGVLVAGDLRNQGRSDLIVLQDQPSTPGARIQFAVLIGRGDGTFLPPVIYTTQFAQGVGPMVVGDFDGDGRADLIVFGEDDPQAQLFLGNGDGTFQAGTSFSLNEGVSVARAIDLNGDGRLDLVTGGATSGIVSVLLGNGDGTFQAPQAFRATMPGSSLGGGVIIGGLALVDYGSPGSGSLGDPDGHLDIVVTTESADGLGPARVILLPGLVDGAGKYAGFGAGATLANVGKAGQIAVIQAGGERDSTDLIVTDAGGVTLIFGKPLTFPSNSTPQTARDLGGDDHIVTPPQVIAPSHPASYFTYTVPTEVVAGSGDQVVDVSALFFNQKGPGLQVEVLDTAGNVLGSGSRFRLVAQQGEVLTIRVFGLDASSFGIYTLNIAVLPQLVSVQALSPLPGGPATSLVLTFQGDRLDRASAEDVGNYTVTWYSPDGQTFRVIPIGVAGAKSVIYTPHAEVGVRAGYYFPTVTRQTVTLLFDQVLPAGTYVVALAPGLRAADYLAGVGDLLAGTGVYGGRSIVSLGQGDKAPIANGAVSVWRDLVVQPTSLGDLSAVSSGTPFLVQLQDDLTSIINLLRSLGVSTSEITDEVNRQIQARFAPTMALAAAGMPLAFTIIWFDPVSFDLETPRGDEVAYDQKTGAYNNSLGQTYVSVGGNVEVVVLANVSGSFQLGVSDISQNAGGGAVLLSPGSSQTLNFTDGFLSQPQGISFALTLPGPGGSGQGGGGQPINPNGGGGGGSNSGGEPGEATSDFAAGPGNLASGGRQATPTSPRRRASAWGSNWPWRFRPRSRSSPRRPATRRGRRAAALPRRSSPT
ncbi:FG-GAP-like repeat-containing protein [Singulisphaera sp. PoT]|uniref:FG-GAP-like repeat-containing protein n=1 Tax=Singulisphaera sp. PoT TaxID=3411797 RepID=UPI003BF520BB